MKKSLSLFLLLMVFINVIGCHKSDQQPVTQAAPTITGFSPAKDTVGGQVIILGTNFRTTTSENKVTINGLNANVSSASDSRLTVTVPEGATSGFITVSISGQTATTPMPLTVTLPNRLLILGSWNYSSSYRSDTLYDNGSVTNTYGYYFPKSSLIPSANFMVFNTNGTAYSFQSAWGRGVSGAFFKDTVQYAVKDTAVYLFYPSGVNTYSWPNFSYPAYQDTITITSLNSNTMTINRKYHYKHLLMSGSEIDIKQSVDTLTR
ncbi:MAG: IPT/TIG domain-containing protein [Flavisolibacter sp.]